LGSRALFAFLEHAKEDHEGLDGVVRQVPTEDAELGALLVLEAREKLIQLADGFDAFLRALSRPAK
jgi:hypothetical protein